MMCGIGITMVTLDQQNMEVNIYNTLYKTKK